MSKKNKVLCTGCGNNDIEKFFIRTDFHTQCKKCGKVFLDEHYKIVQDCPICKNRNTNTIIMLFPKTIFAEKTDGLFFCTKCMIAGEGYPGRLNKGWFTEEEARRITPLKNITFVDINNDGKYVIKIEEVING